MGPKTVLISGGTKGLGKGVALQLLEEGCNVAVFSSVKSNCDALSRELKGKFDSSRFLVLKGDVTDVKSLSVIIFKTLAKFKTVDILINNAGFGYFVGCDSVDLKKFRGMIETNVVGMASLTKLVVPAMKKQKGGLIINIASTSGKTVFPEGEFYAATKFAVMGYSEGIRKELQPFGIKVCTVCPGKVKTDFFSAEELERRRKKYGSYPAMLQVEDVARVVALICSQSSGCSIQDITLVPFE